MQLKAYLADGPMARTLLPLPGGAADDVLRLPYSSPAGGRTALYRIAQGGLPGEVNYVYQGDVADATEGDNSGGGSSPGDGGGK